VCRRRAVARALVSAVIACGVVSTRAETPASAAPSAYLQPYSWGAQASSATDTKQYYNFGALTLGAESPSSLKTTSPSATGSGKAVLSGTDPFSKGNFLRAFNGGTPLFFSEGGTGQHVLVAVRKATTTAHEVWGWGLNTSGQLGIGDTSTSYSNPVKASWTPTESGEEIIQLATGTTHSLMLTQKSGVKRLYAWGANSRGQLGDGTVAASTTPKLISVSGAPSFVSIAAGSYQSVAADSDGFVWAWGCDGLPSATDSTCAELGFYGSRYVVTPTKLTVDSANGITVAVTKKGYVNSTGVATYTVSTPVYAAGTEALSVSIGDPVLDTSLVPITTYEKSGTTVTLTVASHTFKVGDKVYVQGTTTNVDSASLVALTAVTSTTLQYTTGTSATIANTATTTGYVYDRLAIATAKGRNATVPSSFTSYATQARSASVSGTVTRAELSKSVTHTQVSATNVARVFFDSTHSFAAGDYITVAGAGAPYDGTFPITAVSNVSPNFYVQYAVTSAIIAKTAVTSPTTAVVPATTSTVTNVAYTAANVVTLTTSATHLFTAGDAITVSLSDSRYDKVTTILAATYGSTSLTYYLNDTITASTLTSGTATIKGCFTACATPPTGVLEVVVGEGVIAARTATSVHTWGLATSAKNNYYRVGRTNSGTPSTRFQAVVLPTVDGSRTCTPTDMSASAATVAVVCGVDSVASDGNSDQDTVVAWGYNYFGAAGTGSNFISASTSNNTVTSATASYVYTPKEMKACTECTLNGTTTAFTGTAATSGFGVTTHSMFGRALNDGENITQIRLAGTGGYVLTSSGRVLSWGSNMGRRMGTALWYATAGSGSATQEQYSRAARVATRVGPKTPAGVSTTPAAFGAVGNTAYVVDSAGTLWSWGRNGTEGAYLSGRGTIGTYVAASSGAPTEFGDTTGMKFDRIDVPSTARISLIRTAFRQTYLVVNDGVSGGDDVSLWMLGHYDLQLNSSNHFYNYFPGSISSATAATSTSYLLPAKVDLPFGVDTSSSSVFLTDLSCGELHCLAASSDGKIWGWGDVRTSSAASSNTGAIDPDQRDTVSNVPEESVLFYAYFRDITTDLTTAMGVSSFTTPRVAAGNGYSLIVDIGAGGGGRVWGWGSNTSGRASPTNGATTAIAPSEVKDMTVPASPVDVTDVVAISAGYNHSIALRADGSIMTWGADTNGALGDGTTSGKTFALPSLPAGKVAVQVKASGNFSMVRLNDGSLYAWGLNYYGVLGVGDTTEKQSPTLVLGGHSFASFDAFGRPSTSYTATFSAVGVTTSGAVYSWGSNVHGQLGRADRAKGTGSYAASPVAVQTSLTSSLTGADAVVAGSAWQGAWGAYSALALPLAPTLSSSVTVGDGSLSVSWTAPSPLREISAYTVVARSGGTRVTKAVGSGTISTTITGLVNGSTYSVTVYGTNATGDGPESNSVSATPSTTPGTPTSIDAQPTASGLTVTWAVPASTGGAAILDYRVKVVTSGSSASASSGTQVATRDVSGSFSASFNSSDGLSAGTSYDVYIWARNSQGFSATAATDTAIVPGRPSKPETVTAVASVGAAEVSWSEPLSDGGLAIASYVIRAYAVGGVSALVTRVVAASPRTGSITLSDGTTYEITVTASQASAVSSEATVLAAKGGESDRVQVVAGRPAAPTSAPVVTPGNQSVTATWEPVTHAGITITHYRVKAVNGGTTVTQTVAASSACTTICTGTISGLTNGTEYSVSVASGVAASPDSAFGLFGTAVLATPRTTPGTPQNLSTSPSDSSMLVSWEPPASIGGSSILSYTVTLTGGVSPVAVSTSNGETLSSVVTGLVNGTTYSVAVVANNASGASASPATTTQKVFTTPGAPTTSSVLPTSDSLVTASKENTVDGEATVTLQSSHTLQVGQFVDITGLGAPFDGLDIEITGVTSTTLTYTTGDTTAVASTADTDGGIQLGGITIQWADPSDNGGDTITSYTVAITDGETSAQYIVNATNEYLSDASTVATGITCTWASRTCTITKFENIADSGTSELRFSNGSTYVVSISATNAAGAGPTDDPSVVIGQPNEPSSVTTAAAQASFNVCWANPSSIPAGRQIVAYKVTASVAGVSRTKVLSKDEADEATGNQCSGSNVGVTITQFDDGTSPQRGVTYTISVQASVSTAFAERPYGRLSALSTVVPLGIPDAPTLSTVSVDGTTATLTWTAPSNTGGQSITGYTVLSTPSGFGCTTTGALTCVVTGLVRGSTYAFSVVATNASGYSAASTALSATSPTTTTTTTTTIVPSNQTASGGGVTQPGASTTTIVVANSSPLLPKSSWRARSYRGAIGSQVLVSSTAGATVTLNISSRSITVWFKKGSLGGQASIAINGKTLKLVDLYSKKPATAVVRLTAPGKAKTNKVTVRVLGKKSRFSKGTEVALDAVAPGSTCGKGCSKNPSG